MKKQFLKVAWHSPADALIISLLLQANHPYFWKITTTQLASWYNQSFPPFTANLFTQFIQWIGNQWAENCNHAKLQALFAAWKDYQALRLCEKVLRTILAEQLCFNFSNNKLLGFVASLPTISLPKLPKLLEPYLPKGFWWYKSERVQSRWEVTLMERKQANVWKKIHTLFKICMVCCWKHENYT